MLDLNSSGARHGAPRQAEMGITACGRRHLTNRACQAMFRRNSADNGTLVSGTKILGELPMPVKTPEEYRHALEIHEELVHVNIEVQRCESAH